MHTSSPFNAYGRATSIVFNEGNDDHRVSLRTARIREDFIALEGTLVASRGGGTKDESLERERVCDIVTRDSLGVNRESRVFRSRVVVVIVVGASTPRRDAIGIG